MRRFQLSFQDEVCGRTTWIYWKSYASSEAAFAAAKSLLKGLWKDVRLAKVRDSETGDESLYSVR